MSAAEHPRRVTQRISRFAALRKAIAPERGYSTQLNGSICAPSSAIQYFENWSGALKYTGSVTVSS